ncbi:MAG: MucBP domain-containing protein, partial [Anaerococcus sp.]|nr:MucBP domain-containing protein [Anaerococcus sp.]
KENGTKDKKDIEGYEFVETKKDEKGNTKHIYKKKTTPKPEVVTEFVDENGKTISPKEDGKQPKKEIDGYEFVKTEKDEKGNTKHIYKKKTTPSPSIVTKFVDENGNPLAKDEDGKQVKKDIPGYEFVKTINDKDGNVVHVYRLKQTPSPSVETRYFDTEGNQILADKAGENPASTIEGYQFVRTEKDDKGNINHIYQKTAPTVKVETRYIDENGNQLLPPKEGTQNQVNIEGYVYVSTNKDNNGNTIHIYKKVIKPIEDVVTKFVDENGNEIAQTQKGKNPSQNIEGYEIITTKTDDKGNIIYVYRKKPNPTKVVTKFVDEKGNTIAESEDGKKPNKDIKGYEF